MDRQRVERWLLGTIAVGTTCALIASMAHMLNAFGWANSPILAWALAGVMVILNVTFISLAILNRTPEIRWVMITGVVLLSVVEFLGNFAVGGLLVEQSMPVALPAFFHVSRGVTTHGAALFLAGFLPILNGLTVYALAETAAKVLEEPTPNRYVEEVMSILNQD